MRLTAEVVSEADQGLNCLGERELVLRELAIPVIENLALAKDSFDVIDLTSNQITVLGDGFPPFPRLSALYVGHNRIERIESGLATSLPNLTTVILTSNRIATLQHLNLEELQRLKHLETLSISDNPVDGLEGVREALIQALPNLKVLNFSKVPAASREARVSGQSAGAERNRKHGRDAADQPSDGAEPQGRQEDRDGEPRRPRKKARKLTTDEMNTVRTYIEKAKSIDDVNRIQEAIRNGTVTQLIASFQTPSTLAITKAST